MLNDSAELISLQRLSVVLGCSCMLNSSITSENVIQNAHVLDKSNLCMMHKIQHEGLQSHRYHPSQDLIDRREKSDRYPLS